MCEKSNDTELRLIFDEEFEQTEIHDPKTTAFAFVLRLRTLFFGEKQVNVYSKENPHFTVSAPKPGTITSNKLGSYNNFIVPAWLTDEQVLVMSGSDYITVDPVNGVIAHNFTNL